MAGIRVLDLSTVLLGPYATLQLADLGADVIKVEPPAGDTTRFIGPARHAGMSGIFLNLNRNKRSIVLDLKQPAGRKALLRLAATADIFIHAMRPRAIAALGLDDPAVRAHRPDIVYCAAVGFGSAGSARPRGPGSAAPRSTRCRPTESSRRSRAPRRGVGRTG